MGLFSGSKKTIVSSVVYNLAGPEDERANYLKTLVISNVISDRDVSMGNTITQGYLDGPGIKLRSFARWARNQGYSGLLGLRPGSLVGQGNISVNLVSNEIPHAGNQSVNVQTIEIAQGDYTYWVDRWILENAPEKINDAYTADHNLNTNVVTITFSDTTVSSFTLTNYSIDDRYLYVAYRLITETASEPVDVGDVIEVTSFPSMTEWIQTSSVTTLVNVSLDTTVTTSVSYSDGRPNEESIDTTANIEVFNESVTEYEKVEYKGLSVDGSYIYSVQFTDIHTVQYQIVEDTSTVVTEETFEENGETITKTTTEVIVTENTDSVLLVQSNEQLIDIKKWSQLQVFIYREGSSNNTLNSLFNSKNNLGDFFPYIPIRDNNEMLSDTLHPEIYEASKTAVRKSSNGSYTKMIDEIADNESIGDIDYAYNVFGVSLNVQENSCRKYIYKFFQLVNESDTITGVAAYDNWVIEWNAAYQTNVAWGIWKRAQNNEESELFGEPEPEIKEYPSIPLGTMTLVGDGPFSFKFEIAWHYINEYTGAGLAKEGAKLGELWFEINETDTYVEQLESQVDTINREYSVDKITLYWQESINSWRAITIAGLRHNNDIYKGKKVTIGAAEALTDTEESGFIIPLHEGIFREMSLKDSTQMSTACSFVVFNCYQVVKQKWYQTGAFKILVVIAAIAVSVYFPPAGGLLGSAAGVGAALGFSGALAVIVGTIANALAAIILAELLQRGATALFGDKLGSIIGAIATVVAVTVGSAYMGGANISAGFSSLMKPDNLMQLSNAVGKGYSGYMQASIAETQQDTLALLEEYEQVSGEINTKFDELFSVGHGIVDTSIFTAANSQEYAYESSQSFLDRTLLVGSDIAELSIRMVDQFVAITTSTTLDR